MLGVRGKQYADKLRICFQNFSTWRRKLTIFRFCPNSSYMPPRWRREAAAILPYLANLSPIWGEADIFRRNHGVLFRAGIGRYGAILFHQSA
jgi:hypothetical protein